MGLGDRYEGGAHSNQSTLDFSALAETQQRLGLLPPLVSKSHEHDFWLVVPPCNNAGHSKVQWKRKATAVHGFLEWQIWHTPLVIPLPSTLALTALMELFGNMDADVDRL